MTNVDREVRRIEKQDAWDEDDEPVESTVKRPLDKVVPVRMPSDKWEELRREAQEIGVRPTTLARMWLLERLRETNAKRRAS
jgi:hypothetical protein